MKKFTLLMAAALVGVSASAQLYVTGDNVTGATAAWAPATPLELAAENGVYSFSAKGNFKISTAKGEWTAFNGGAKMLDGSWNKATNTASASMKSGDANILSPMGDTETLISYTVSEDLTTIKATLPEGVTFPVGQILDMYMVGNMNDWTPNDANYKMKTTDGKVYTLEGVSLAADAQFKFCGGAWGVRELTGGKYGTAGTEMSLGSGSGNITLSGAMDNVTIKLTVLNDDFSAGTLEIGNGIITGVSAVEAANGEAVYFNMQGVRVANPENGLFIRVQNGKAVKVVK